MLEKNVMGPEDAERSAVRDKSDAADRETPAPSPPDGEEAKADVTETEAKVLAVAFPMAPIDRYGFLVTDK